jgi:hypothetical protein
LFAGFELLLLNFDDLALIFVLLVGVALGLLWFFLLSFSFGSNEPGLNEVFEKYFV